MSPMQSGQPLKRWVRKLKIPMVIRGGHPMQSLRFCIRWKNCTKIFLKKNLMWQLAMQVWSAGLFSTIILVWMRFLLGRLFGMRIHRMRRFLFLRCRSFGGFCWRLWRIRRKSSVNLSRRDYFVAGWRSSPFGKG